MSSRNIAIIACRDVGGSDMNSRYRVNHRTRPCTVVRSLLFFKRVNVDQIRFRNMKVMMS